MSLLAQAVTAANAHYTHWLLPREKCWDTGVQTFITAPPRLKVLKLICTNQNGRKANKDLFIYQRVKENLS